MPHDESQVIFDEPLINFADGDDRIFEEYKDIIAPVHLTPREALAKAYDKKPGELPKHLPVISWIMPVTEETRKTNRKEKTTPSHLWAYTRWYGEKFNDALRKHMVEFLTKSQYLVVTPVLQPYFRIEDNDREPFSNWSERHIAYAAGLGTFSLSDGFITERGIAHRCGSVVTDLILPPTERTARDPFSNCLFYVDGSCNTCIARCPAQAISEKGHDKKKCNTYVRKDIGYLREKYKVGITGCGLCQTEVPCEYQNRTRKRNGTRL